MKYGVGIRPIGMGGAFTAVADDINSIYYNPAGLGDLAFGYSFGNQDLHGGAYSNNSFNMLNLGFLGISGWKVKSNAGESLDVTTTAIGNRGPAGFGWGFSYKNIRAELASTSFSSWSGDVGLLLRVTPEISLGLLGQDIIKDSDLDIPSTARFGFAYMPYAGAIKLALDAESGRTGDVGALTQYGAEAAISDGFMLRAGSNRGRGTFGVSMNFPVFEVDYAYIASDDLQTEAIHSVSFGLDVSIDKKRPNALIRPKGFALIDVRGSLVGGRDEFSIFGGARTGADGILSQIRKATKDDSIDGILLRISGFEGGLGSAGIVQELRAELKRAKKAGKKVVVYIESSALGDEYYLASVADHIVAPSGAFIGGLGKSVVITRVTDLMDMIGIEWQVMTKGKYKSTFDSLSPDMTDDQREMISSIISDMYRQMINDISDDRGIEVSKLKEIGDGNIFTASTAKDLDLIDEIGYFKDAADAAGKLNSKAGEVRLVKAEDLYTDDAEYFLPWPYKVAVIEVDGEIVTGRSGSNLLLGGTYIGADTITEQIKAASDDMMVRAIILRVNSPGGSPVASGQIYQELLRAREKGKVVIASMGDVAASGGYFICAAADKIVADPGSITGSIGVIGAIPVLSELYDKIGIKAEVVKEGEHSDMFSGLRKLTTKERESLDALFEETYTEFKSVVAEGRGMTTAEVEEIAQGRVYTGSQAFEVGLVDKLGGFSDSVDLAADLAKIPGDPKIIYYREEFFWQSAIMEVSERLGISQGIFPKLGPILSEYRLNY
jgi:protease-4